MTIDQIIVLLVSVLAIVGVYWFFLGKSTKAVVAGSEILIKVDGGYTPENIEVPVGKNTKLKLLRTDPSSCLEEIVISDFKVRMTLPLNETVEINIKPEHAGTFRFSCGMGMYHGTITAK